MVDERVDFVFGGAAAVAAAAVVAVVVFLFERWSNLYYNQPVSHKNLKAEKKSLPEVDSTGAAVPMAVPQFIDPIDTALKGIVGTPPFLPPISNRPKLPFDFKFEGVEVEADEDDDEEENFAL